MSKEQREMLYRDYLQQLKCYAFDLPEKYRLRSTPKLLSQLAKVLLDETVFLIISELKEIQEMTERALFTDREKLAIERETLKEDLSTVHIERVRQCQMENGDVPDCRKSNELERVVLEQETEKVLRSKDFAIIKELDNLVIQQQVTLEKAGVPCFYVTEHEEDIQLQMYFLKFMFDIAGKRNL